MKTIGDVLGSMTMSDFARAADRDLRGRAANERLIAIEMETTRKAADAAAENARILLELDRPEYLYAKNAVRKDKQYQRYRKNCVAAETEQA